MADDGGSGGGKKKKSKRKSTSPADDDDGGSTTTSAAAAAPDDGAAASAAANSSAAASTKKKKRASKRVSSDAAAAADGDDDGRGKAKAKPKSAAAAVKAERRLSQLPPGVSPVDASKAKALDRSSGLFSPRIMAGDEDHPADDEPPDAPVDLFSPRPTGAPELDKQEKMTNKEKRNSIRKEIRKSIRASRGLPPMDPDKLLEDGAVPEDGSGITPELVAKHGGAAAAAAAADDVVATEAVSDGTRVIKHGALSKGMARPVIVHRAIYGSVERFMSILIEHTAGQWPFWISPRQLMVIPVSPVFDEYAKAVGARYHDAGFYVDVDTSGNTLNKKVREAQLAHYNYQLVVGAKERDSDSVNVRTRANEVKGMVSVDEHIKQLKDECAQYK